MPRWKSQKTKKCVVKRFKVSAKGKILRRAPGKGHLLASKNAKRRRRLRAVRAVDKTDYQRLKETLPFHF